MSLPLRCPKQANRKRTQILVLEEIYEVRGELNGKGRVRRVKDILGVTWGFLLVESRRRVHGGRGMKGSSKEGRGRHACHVLKELMSIEHGCVVAESGSWEERSILRTFYFSCLGLCE